MLHTLHPGTRLGVIFSGVVIPIYIMKQEKVIKQPKQYDNYVRNTGSQRQSKDAKLKKL
jgi:hypothetical protein